MSKKGTHFCTVTNLQTVAENCFQRLSDKNYFLGMDRTDFIDEITDFYSVVNILHPFREGNGRTQRLFISQLIKHNGYDFNIYNMSKDDLMIATIKSANGVNDSLRELFYYAIAEKPNFPCR